MTDYQWFADLTQESVYFVTRVKDNAHYAVVEERELPQRKGLRRDQVIFVYKLAQAGVGCLFRRVEYYDEETDQVLVFLSAQRQPRRAQRLEQASSSPNHLIAGYGIIQLVAFGVDSASIYIFIPNGQRPATRNALRPGAGSTHRSPDCDRLLNPAHPHRKYPDG